MIDRAALKTDAKHKLTGKWGVAIGTTIVGELVVGAAASIIPGIGGLILAGVIEVGLAIIFLEIVRGWQCNFEDLFKGFNNFGTTCAAGLLVSIFTFLWSLLFVIPGIIKQLSYSMTYYILADNPQMSATEAINTSRAMMDGHKGELFVLYLSFIGWVLLSMLTLGILMLYVAPYMAASEANFYEAVKAEYAARQGGQTYAAPDANPAQAQ